MTWSETDALALTGVFEALNKAKLRWLVLRNYDEPPRVDPAKDVDTGVPQSRLAEAAHIVDQALKGHGFTRNQSTFFEWRICSTYALTTTTETHSLKIDLMDGYPGVGRR